MASHRRGRDQVHGSERLLGEHLTEKVGGYHFVISTYSLIHRDIDKLTSVEWETVTLDEAQNIKNYWTRQEASQKFLIHFVKRGLAFILRTRALLGALDEG